MKTIAPDSRDTTLHRLKDVFEEALTISLMAQACARGHTLDDARKLVRDRDSAEYQKLIVPSGGSGYLSFQWIAQSLQRAAAEIAKIDLQSFWILVQAGQSTVNVYETQFERATEILNDGTSGARKNLNELFAGYPKNQIGVQSLSMLKKLQDSLEVIEQTIAGLLKLSPPAKPSAKSRISWKVILAAFLISLLSVPIFYWLRAGGPKTTPPIVAAEFSKDVATVKAAAHDSPQTLPFLVFRDIVPATSNVLLLLTAALALWRAFSKDARKNNKVMSEELTKAAEILRKVGAG